MNNYRVMIGICAYGGFPPETVASLLSLYRSCKIPVQIRIEPYTYIHVARTNLLNSAIETNATHLMFIDADMVFPEDGVDRLAMRNKDIVGGVYKKRIEPHYPVIYRKEKDALNVIEDYKKNDLFKVDAIGTGFLLCDINVFKKMDPPFFYHGRGEKFGLKQNDLYDLGEDTTFCLKARENGFDIWADSSIDLGHISQKIIQ